MDWHYSFDWTGRRLPRRAGIPEFYGCKFDEGLGTRLDRVFVG